MAEPKWTPGPWRLGDDATGEALTIWAAEPGICITSVFDDRMGDDTPPMPKAQANARLIAAAPELYKALFRVSDMLFLRPDMIAALRPLMGPAEHAIFEAAAAALAKVRGDPIR